MRVKRTFEDWPKFRRKQSAEGACDRLAAIEHRRTRLVTFRFAAGPTSQPHGVHHVTPDPYRQRC